MCVSDWPKNAFGSCCLAGLLWDVCGEQKLTSHEALSELSAPPLLTGQRVALGRKNVGLAI